jgi:hypothetical protein
MIHQKLYERMSYAYQDAGETPDLEFKRFNDPRETVENTRIVLEHRQRSQEISEWQAYFFIGEANHWEAMLNPGDNYRMAAKRLDLDRKEARIGIRVYRLFRDNFYALPKLSGITPWDIYRISNKCFETTLGALTRDFAVIEPEPELDELDE